MKQTEVIELRKAATQPIGEAASQRLGTERTVDTLTSSRKNDGHKDLSTC